MNITVIAHNIRSAHNVGSIFRTCEGFGVQHLYLSGYTPYPPIPGDTRLPHETRKVAADIHKTALGAEQMVPFSYHSDVLALVENLRRQDFTIVALEQTPNATPLPQWQSPQQNIALVLGEEVHGVPPELLAKADEVIEIPMQGSKESFNVSVACGIALYGLLYSR